MKRALDLVLASLALLVFSPLFLPIMLALRMTGEGEVFYRQRRIGRDGQPFGILKFATMLKNSPNMTGGDISTRDDPRILPLGRYLRSTKINELPQLINIVRGDMSIIGPRPFTPSIAALFATDHWTALSHLRPGLSGIGSIVFRDEEGLLANLPDRLAVYRTTVVPYKAALERWYAAHQSMWLDIKLIALTIAAVVAKDADPARYLPGLPSPPADLQALRRASTTMLV